MGQQQQVHGNPVKSMRLRQRHEDCIYHADMAWKPIRRQIAAKIKLPLRCPGCFLVRQIVQERSGNHRKARSTNNYFATLNASTILHQGKNIHSGGKALRWDGNFRRFGINSLTIYTLPVQRRDRYRAGRIVPGWDGDCDRCAMIRRVW